MAKRTETKLADVNSVNLDELTDIRLLMTSLMNADLLKQMTSEQVREFVEQDIAERLVKWTSCHFPDPFSRFTGTMLVDVKYTIMDYHYNKHGYYIGQLSAQVQENVVLTVIIKDLKRDNNEGARQ